MSKGWHGFKQINQSTNQASKHASNQASKQSNGSIGHKCQKSSKQAIKWVNKKQVQKAMQNWVTLGF